MKTAESVQFNAFENALDFSFWRELCERQGTLRHFRRGEYFAQTGEVLKKCRMDCKRRLQAFID